MNLLYLEALLAAENLGREALQGDLQKRVSLQTEKFTEWMRNLGWTPRIS